MTDDGRSGPGYKVRMLRSPRVVLITALLVGACGDDNTVPPGAGPDGGGGADAPPIGEQFDSPDDFTRDGCAPGTLAGFDPRGVWHHEAELDGFGVIPVVTRWYDDEGGELSAVLNGRDADTVTLTEDDLFARWQTVDGEDVEVGAWDICRRDEDGTLFGRLARCSSYEAQCLTATIKGYPIHRRAGEDVAQGFELLGTFDGGEAWAGSGESINVRVADGIAYVARYEDGLRIVDVGDPAAMTELGALAPENTQYGEIYNDVKVVDGPGGTRYALMASDQRGVVAVDVTDPSHPVEAATFPAPEGPGIAIMRVHTLFTESRGGRTLAYLAQNNQERLEIWDVTDPAHPTHEGDFRHPDADTAFGVTLHDLFVQDGRAYLNYWGLGLVVVDATDPANVRLLGQYDDYTPRTNHSNWVTTVGDRKICVIGDEDWGAHLRVIDVTDPDSPAWMTKIGELRLRDEVSIHNIMAFGDHAYVAWYQDGLRRVDLSDPTQPAFDGYYNTWGGGPGDNFFEGAIGLDVDVYSGLYYVVDTHRGLFVLRETP